jgi:hypothetical protein
VARSPNGMPTQTRTHIICTMAPQPENASRSTAFMSVCEIVSNKSSGSWKTRVATRQYTARVNGRGLSERGPCERLTRSGSHRLSATPKSLSVAVPHTTKSLAKLMQPIKSVEQMKGLFVFFDSPTTMGSMKYGLNLKPGQRMYPGR